jgi:hypothetical protein
MSIRVGNGAGLVHRSPRIVILNVVGQLSMSHKTRYLRFRSPATLA